MIACHACGVRARPAAGGGEDAAAAEGGGDGVGEGGEDVSGTGLFLSQTVNIAKRAC
jgi:hypothetical protein